MAQTNGFSDPNAGAGAQTGFAPPAQTAVRAPAAQAGSLGGFSMPAPSAGGGAVGGWAPQPSGSGAGFVPPASDTRMMPSMPSNGGGIIRAPSGPVSPVSDWGGSTRVAQPQPMPGMSTGYQPQPPQQQPAPQMGTGVQPQPMPSYQTDMSTKIGQPQQQQPITSMPTRTGPPPMTTSPVMPSTGGGDLSQMANNQARMNPTPMPIGGAPAPAVTQQQVNALRRPMSGAV